MDLKSFCTPTHTALELAAARAGTQARVPRVVQAAPKSERVPEPVARTELWKQFHAGAVRDGHPDPEKFADSAVRSRELALKQRAKRSKAVMLTEVPKSTPSDASCAKPKASGGPKCQAKTLEGRQCGFAATCGHFCKKHAPKAAPRPAFQLVTEPRRFTGVRLKGYLNAKPSLVEGVLGKPNGTTDEMVTKEWKLVFSDGTPAAVFYSSTDPSLHVCGESVEVLSRVRQLLAL
jgi:hypothetical protein